MGNLGIDLSEPASKCGGIDHLGGVRSVRVDGGVIAEPSGAGMGNSGVLGMISYELDVRLTCCWSGRYAGFVMDQWLFAADSRSLGWFDSQANVWRANDSFLGKNVEDYYIPKRTTRMLLRWQGTDQQTLPFSLHRAGRAPAG